MPDNNEATLEQHYVDAFEANLGLKPQQTDSRLVDLVDADLNFAKKGDSINADDLDDDDAEPEEVEDRYGPTPEGAPGKRRRLAFFTPFHKASWLGDDVDNAKSLSDPSNATMQSIMAGLNRYRDRKIIATLNAAAKEGRNGDDATNVAFPAAQQIAIDDWSYAQKGDASTGNAALTFAKINKAKVMLGAAELGVAVPMSGLPIMLVSAEQIGELLRDPTITSNDYNAVRALMAGEINSFMGFRFVQSQLTPRPAANRRTCFAFHGKAIRYRSRKLVDVKVQQRADRQYNWQAYYKGWHAALRRHDSAVVEIACTETTVGG